MVIKKLASERTLSEWLPLSQVCPRGRLAGAPHGVLENIGTFKQANDLKEYLSHTRSSGDDILSWMPADSVREEANGQSTAWMAILKVVETDTLCFLGITLENLDKITEGITNETLLQDHLHEWRPLITRYLLELPRMKASLLEFRSFMITCGVTGQPQNSIDKLSGLIDNAYSQAEKVYNSLRTEMSIVDSRRGIAEAKGVSKLTELAFVFVPITFAASIFSMQIKELETAPPLYAFIIAALLCVIISYAIRLSTRSDVLLDLKRRPFNTVRSRYGIPPNRPISTRKFMAYVLHPVSDRFLQVAYILGMGTALTSALSLIWTKSHMDVFFKAAITALSVVMVLSQIWRTLPHKISVVNFLASRFKQPQRRPLSRGGENTMSV